MLSPEQLKLRKSGLGSSDISAVALLNPWHHPIDTWLEKVGDVQRQDADEDNDKSEVGSELEDAVARVYARRHKVDLLDWPSVTLKHPKYSWVLASPDRAVRRADFRGPPPSPHDPLHWQSSAERLVEIKCVGQRVAHHWGPEGEDNAVPDYVIAQVTWQMLVTGVRQCDVVALFGGTDVRRYPIDYSPALADALMHVGGVFWHEYVLPRKEPPLDGSDGTIEYLRQRWPENRRPPLDARQHAALDALVREYAEIRARAGACKEQLGTLENRIKAAIGDADGVLGSDYKVTWKKNSKGTPRWKEIATTLGATPELIAANTTDAPRVFRVAGQLFKGGGDE